MVPNKSLALCNAGLPTNAVGLRSRDPNNQMGHTVQFDLVSPDNTTTSPKHFPNTICNRKMRALGTLVSRRVSWNGRRKEICSLIFSEHFSTDGGDGVESSSIKIFDRDLKRKQVEFFLQWLLAFFL